MSLSNRAAPESRGGRAPQRSPVLHPLIGTHSCRRWKHVGTRTSPSRSHESRFCHGKRPPNSASRAGAGIELIFIPYASAHTHTAAPESRGGRAPQRSPVLHPLIGTHSCRRWKHVGTRTSPSRSHESRFCHGKRPPNSASRAGAGIEPCIYPYTFVRSDRQSISKLCPPSAVYGQRRNQGRAQKSFFGAPLQNLHCVAGTGFRSVLPLPPWIF